MMITSLSKLVITPEQHPNNTQRNTQITPNNNDNNNRSTDIKFLNDAYVKNERLHQLTYNNRTLKIRLFKLTLRGFLCFSSLYLTLNF